MSSDAVPATEQSALLGDSSQSVAVVSKSVARRLYTSHFLSTWNSRVFEFGAVLYLATIFPDTLLPMSIYALVRGFSAIVFAPVIGAYIDTGNRLQVVRFSIVVQRIAVALSCIIFYFLTVGSWQNADLDFWPQLVLGGLLMMVLAILACIEKLCSIINLISVEKDWVIVVASSNPTALSVLNAQMRRIDLSCKLLGPLFIALVHGVSPKIAIIMNFLMNTVSVGLEYFAIARVYYDTPALQETKIRRSPDEDSIESDGVTDSLRVFDAIKKSVADFQFYFHHRLFLPSIAGSVLYLTVLSFSGQMITYLLSSGFNSTQIGISRTLAVVSEVLATWAAPWLMGRIGAVRTGLWMANWQTIALSVGVAIFWNFSSRNPSISAAGLVGGTIISRLGLRGFDLCVQLIIQEEVEPENRGVFSSVEAACQNMFELLSYASTIAFSQPQEFKWPSLISLVAVLSANSVYTFFAYLRRGHLLHLDALTKLLRSSARKQRERERGIDRINSRRDF